MGKYFENATLDGLWARLVDAAEKATGSSLPNTGIKGIHDALFSYFNLAHGTPPTTLGDYMKGIAVAARYKKFGYIDADTKNTLEAIVDYLEDTASADYIFTLSNQLYLTCNKIIEDLAGDIMLNLYCDNVCVGSIQGASGTIPYNFLDGDWQDEAPTFAPGQYYATITWPDTAGDYHSYTSNTVSYAGSVSNDYVITLDNEGNYSLTPSSNDACLDLYDIATSETISIISANKVGSGNVASHMIQNHRYYLIAHTISEDTAQGTYYSNTITYIGSSSGASVTVALNAQGIATATYTNCSPMSDATWTLYSGDVIIASDSASGAYMVNFSSYMQNGSTYYVTISTPIEDGETVSAESNTIEYREEQDSESISIEASAYSDVETYQIYIIPSYSGNISSDAILTYTVTLFNDMAESVYLTTKTYPDCPIDVATTIDAKNLYTNYLKDSHYRVVVDAVCSFNNLTASDTVEFTWNWDNGGSGSDDETLGEAPIIESAYQGTVTLKNYTNGTYPCRIMYDESDMGETGEITYDIFQDLDLVDGSVTLNYYEPTYMSNFRIAIKYGENDYDWTEYVSFTFEGY